jgi:hypothetical protein
LVFYNGANIPTPLRKYRNSASQQNEHDKHKKVDYHLADGTKRALGNGHAEKAFIEYVLQNRDGDNQEFTHILGMGCSRLHCKECDELLKMFLGNRYHQFTAATRQKYLKDDEKTKTPAIKIEYQNSKSLKMTVQEATYDIELRHEQDAVNSKKREEALQYPLSEVTVENMSKFLKPHIRTTEQEGKITLSNRPQTIDISRFGLDISIWCRYFDSNNTSTTSSLKPASDR